MVSSGKSLSYRRKRRFFDRQASAPIVSGEAPTVLPWTVIMRWEVTMAMTMMMMMLMMLMMMTMMTMMRREDEKEKKGLH